MLYMDPSLDTQSLSTATSSSTPHTPSPSMNNEQPTATANNNNNASSSSGSNTVDYGSFEPSANTQSSAQFYLDYPSSQQQQQQQHHHHQPPMLSIDVSHTTSSTAPSAAVAVAGPLYRRASFPFVQHDHSMSDFANKYAQNDQQQLIPEAHHHHHQPHPQHRYESGYEDQVELGHHHHHHPHSASAMVVPTQQMLPQQHPPHLFYRPSSSSSSVSSVSAPPSGFLNPAMSSIPVMHTDDAASKETQYLRRKCFNCGTTEPPSWRRSTLNPGKIVCNKCGLYERTHNKPRPHQFGLRPGNKTRKQPPPQGQQQPHHHHHQQQPAGRLSGLSSPSSSPKRHGMSVKKEQLDYSQAMRRGSIASINSGSGASDWDDHSGYSTASSAYHSTLGMAPPFGTHQQHSPAQQQQQQHGLSHHHQGHTSSHVPNHHGHHPYNSAYSMPPPPRSTSHGIRLPQAPPMKVPATGNKAGSSSPVTASGVNVISGGGNNSHSNHLAHIHTTNSSSATSSGGSSSTGNARHSSSPDNMSMLSPSALAAGGLSGSSPYGSSSTGPSSTGGGSAGGAGGPASSASSSSYSPGSTIFLRGPPQPTPLAPPPMMASADYYARRGSTSQIPHHHHHSASSSSSLYHEADMSTMRRGSVGAIGMGGGGYGHGSPFGNNHTGSGGHHHRAGLPPPSSWNSHYSSGNGVPLSEMSLTPTPAPAGGGGSNTSADSTPQLGYANVTSATIGDLTPSPPTHHALHHNGASASPPIGASIQPEIASLAV